MEISKEDASVGLTLFMFFYFAKGIFGYYSGTNMLIVSITLFNCIGIALGMRSYKNLTFKKAILLSNACYILTILYSVIGIIAVKYGLVESYIIGILFSRIIFALITTLIFMYAAEIFANYES